MPIDLATIGSLVAITKNLIGVIKGVSSFWGASTRPKVQEEFKGLYGRIDVLALQLEQCERLTRSVPAWLLLAKRIQIWGDAASLATQAQKIDADLRMLIHESMHDYFSWPFFKTDYDRLPGVVAQIETFRARIKSLDQTMSSVEGNFQHLQAKLSQIQTQFKDAFDNAEEIQGKAEELQIALIRELREASANGLKEINAV